MLMPQSGLDKGAACIPDNGSEINMQLMRHWHFPNIKPL